MWKLYATDPRTVLAFRNNSPHTGSTWRITCSRSHPCSTWKVIRHFGETLFHLRETFECDFVLGWNYRDKKHSSATLYKVGIAAKGNVSSKLSMQNENGRTNSRRR